MALPVPDAYKGQTLPDGEIARWAKGAGIPSDQIATAVAIALAESGGRIDARGGPNFDGTYDYGLWQINEGAHPEKFRHWSSWWSSENSEMMAAVYREAGNKWTPWTVYKTGAYLLYMQRGRIAAAFPGSDPITGGEDSYNRVVDLPDAMVEVGNAVKSIAEGVFKAGAWMAKPDNWMRVAQVALGGGLVIAALAIVVAPVAKQVAGPALSAATKGAVKT